MNCETVKKKAYAGFALKILTSFVENKVYFTRLQCKSVALFK